MEDKTVVIYISDEEYASRLARVLNKRKPEEVVIERVTERESFWRSREKSGDGGSWFWLTDDSDPAADMSDNKSVIRLSAVSDHKNNTIGFCQDQDSFAVEFFGMIGLSGTGMAAADGPAPGVYGIYAPCNDAGQLCAALLSQELAAYGSCLYVNTSAFPILYVREDARDKRHLGELFFRLDGKGFSELEVKLERDYGAAKRLPVIFHYRDLWDIDEKDFGSFLRRLRSECKKTYVVVCFNDIREAMPMVQSCDSFHLIEGNPYEDVNSRWMSFAEHESDRVRDISVVTMPAGYASWGEELCKKEPEMWLTDQLRSEFIRNLWRESL